ncbi:MAG: alpha/beta fold hydrolase [Solirubrobacteraceae bacterium]|jgi:pimeloyl-ACP methyl ester carboxylesterase
MKREIAANGVILTLEEAGTGVPVVGLHGLTATRRYLLMGSHALQRHGHRVILYDARGHGESSPAADGDYSYSALAADLVAVLDSLGLARVVLAGASMGAHTALRVALEQPQRIAALALVTPGYDPRRSPARLERWDALAEALRDGGPERFVEVFDVKRLPAAWREVVATVVEQRLARHRHPLAVADALVAVPRSRPFESFADLAQISAPTLVVGSRDEADPDHPLATAAAYAQAIPGAELLVEEEGRSPIAWQGGQLSRAIIALAARSA